MYPHHLPVPWLKEASEWSLGIMAQSFLMTAFKLICVTLVYSCISKQERSYRGTQSRLLGARSRNEEAVYSTRNTIYSLKLPPTLSTSILFICFWIDLVRVLATTGNTPASQAIRLYKHTKISGPRFQRNYIIARHQKNALHGASFTSSSKINRMLITRPICLQWKFTTPDHRSFANYDSYFFSTTQ